MSLSCPAGRKYGAVDAINPLRHYHGATRPKITGHAKKGKVYGLYFLDAGVPCRFGATHVQMHVPTRGGAPRRRLERPCNAAVFIHNQYFFIHKSDIFIHKATVSSIKVIFSSIKHHILIHHDTLLARGSSRSSSSAGRPEHGRQYWWRLRR